MRVPRFPLTALAVSIALSALCASAQDSSPATDSEAASTQTAPLNAANTIAITDRYLTAVQAEVANKVDTRNAVTGQQVTLRVLAPATLADGAELPRDAKLVGRIIRVHAFQKDHPGAMLAITIDHAELNNGKTIPVRCVIRMVAPPAGLAPGSSERNAPAVGGSLMGVSGVPMEGDASTSGSLGGAMGNAGPMGTGMPTGGGVTTTGTRGVDGGPGGIATGDPGVGGADPMHPVGETVGSVLGDTSTLNQPAERPVASAGEHLADVPHRTALPGVLLSNSTSAGVSGTLTAFDKNISLDTGTRLVLGVITR